MKVVIWVLDRLVPTLLMGASAALLTTGVLSYAPSAFGEWQTPAPTTGGDPLFESPAAGTSTPDVAWASGGPSGQPTEGQSGGPSSAPTLTLAPGATPSPEPSAGPTDAQASGQPPTSGPSSAPTVAPSGWPTARPTAGATSGPLPTPTARASDAPGSTPRPTSAPGTVGHGEPSRIVIPSLDIDLPLVPSDLVVPGNTGFYPLCDVAMYMVGFVKPGQAGTTYIYGHAQDGMFAPLLHASKYNNGASMLGALVQVYTDDNMVHLYEITLVKRHATDLSITRTAPGVHQLVLQTSEGWSGHIQKLQVAARPVAVLPASARDANPVPHPRVCLPHS